VPQLVADTRGGKFAWEEFFNANIRNPHSRAAYCRSVKRFLRWVEPQGVPLAEITPGMVGAYFNQFQGCPSMRKLHLAGLRAFFDALVVRHVILLNPADSVRG
jgi:hypothetical protein